MDKYAPAQVIFRNAAERKEIQDFVREHYGRSFSEQCRRMLLEARREAKEAQKAAA